MCGIAGIVRFDRPGSASSEALRVVRGRLVHRGPDGEGEAYASHCALASTRLAMIDAVGGAQPLRSADRRYLLVYNGELFNDAALRDELGGEWRTRSDTETVLRAWQAWGEDALPRLDGMFAFFVWDEERKLGFGARDRLGVKPFAYTTEAGFAFASEAQALLPLLAHVRPNVDEVVSYLTAPAFSGVARSPFAAIRYLQPGFMLRVGANGVTTRRYWRWTPREDRVEPEDLREGLREAVQGALRSDVPLGLFSSGGLDSTALAAFAGRLPAFTITFDGQERWTERDSKLVISDDTPFAREAAANFGLPTEEVRFERATVAQQLIELAAANDALPSTEQELSQRALARFAAQRVKGVLVGDAADETHYGYHFLLDPEATASPEVLIRRLGSLAIRREVEADPIGRIASELRAVAAEGGVSFEQDGLAATTQLIVNRWLPRLLHNGDLHTMAFGLEARVPFASSRLVDLAQRVPPAVALRDGVEKWLLREALRGLIPERIRLRRKSAFPKDPSIGPVLQQLARAVIREPHPLVRAVVNLEALAPLFRAAPLSEAERHKLFRVVSLHHWAIAHHVAGP